MLQRMVMNFKTWLKKAGIQKVCWLCAWTARVWEEERMVSELTEDIFDRFFDFENKEPTSIPVGKKDALQIAASAVIEDKIDASGDDNELLPLGKQVALVC